ncbi:pyridoxamine 5'-phosphate oxidase family protein [Streptomyces sp. HNM0575]|nr:pyridoxamine 5'-phosphate oxidase family protein [Streptomyces sp. HNM0575]
MSESASGTLDGLGEPGAPRHMKPLDRAEALRLLASVALGRLFFTQRALPAVRPVIHVLDGEDVIVRLSDADALAAVAAPAGGPPAVVAFEADVIDAERHVGWSVVVTGYACRIGDKAELERYGRLLRHRAPQAVTGTLRIRPELITGFEFVDATALQ